MSPQNVAYVAYSAPPDLTAEGMFSECRRRADRMKERFEAMGGLPNVFGASGDRGEALVTVDRIPPDAGSEQETFTMRIVSILLGMLKKMGGGDPVRAFTVWNMESYGRRTFSKGPDGKFVATGPDPDPSKKMDLVAVTVCQSGQKKGAIIIFENRMFLCEGGIIENRLSVPSEESMPHLDTVVLGVFDRMVLYGETFGRAGEMMVADVARDMEKNSIGRLDA